MSDKLNKETVEKLALTCGLSTSTIRDLLNRGWSYHETIREPGKWVAPAYNFIVNK